MGKVNNKYQEYMDDGFLKLRNMVWHTAITAGAFAWTVEHTQTHQISRKAAFIGAGIAGALCLFVAYAPVKITKK